MNAEMVKAELTKIFSKKVIWISMAVFLALYLVLKLQFIDTVGVRYTLEPVRAELTAAVQNEEFHAFVRDGGYARSLEELRPYLPEACFSYIEEYRQSERVCRSLKSDLVRILNNYFERIDARAAWIAQLADAPDAPDASQSTLLAAAKAKLLQAYRDTPVAIELNLETSANNLIDVNHSAVFPGLIMLVILVGISGIYSDEYTSRTESALLTARKGRRGVFFAKLFAAALFVCTVVGIMEGFYMIVTAICHHAPGGSISAASTYGLSLTLYGGSVSGFCTRQILGTLLAAFTLGCITMCISAHSKNALIPFFTAGVFYGGTALYANMIRFPEYLSSVWSLPGEWSLFMLQTQVELVAKGRYTAVRGVLLPTLLANALFHVLLFVVCLALCYRGYTRKQIT